MITTTSEPEIGAGGDQQGGAGCLNAGQIEGPDECIEKILQKIEQSLKDRQLKNRPNH